AALVRAGADGSCRARRRSPVAHNLARGTSPAARTAPPLAFVPEPSAPQSHRACRTGGPQEPAPPARQPEPPPLVTRRDPTPGPGERRHDCALVWASAGGLRSGGVARIARSWTPIVRSQGPSTEATRALCSADRRGRDGGGVHRSRGLLGPLRD